MPVAAEGTRHTFPVTRPPPAVLANQLAGCNLPRPRQHAGNSWSPASQQVLSYFILSLYRATLLDKPEFLLPFDPLSKLPDRVSAVAADLCTSARSACVAQGRRGRQRLLLPL